MAEKQLTQKRVDALKTPVDKGEVNLWDGSLTGFGVRALRSGGKNFSVKYRNKHGAPRRISLGNVAIRPLAEAREEARQILAAVARGEDPSADRAESKKAVLVSELAERYLREHADAHKKKRSRDEDRRFLEKILLPRWGHKAVESITRKDAAKLHHELRQTPITANRVLALVSKMFSLAEAWGLRPDASNPCRHVRRNREDRRDRYLSNEELARLGVVLAEAEKNNTESPSVILALRLLLLTGARKTEVLDLRWDQVDIETGTLALSDSKTGKKRIVLGAAAREVLEHAPRLAGNPFVCFGKLSGQRLVGLQKAWERIRKKAGIADVRIHDLRHSFGAVAASSGMSLVVIGGLLHHTQAATTLRYSHVQQDPLREAVELIDARIAAAMRAKPKVVSLKS